MIAVIKGDIVSSRNLKIPEKWIHPLKKLLGKWGDTPKDWELVWGDFFQLEIDNPEEALQKALAIKALIKKTEPGDSGRKTSPIDVRMSIGIGEKTFSGERVSESNGPAFIYAGEKFETLKKERVNLAVQSPWEDFDEEINRYLRLAGIVIDRWTISSSELMEVALQEHRATQKEIGKRLGIKQNSVSDRWNRAKMDEILEIEKVYRSKLKQLIQV
jgi:hypothetical protein